ncbi:MAG: hypothetical protein IKV67_12125, partial [Paludibacteraceae bacterium]|nr:hypothetical protein [Paludibacteraceae bacterium]
SSVDCSTSDDSLPFDEEHNDLSENDKKEIDVIINEYYKQMGEVSAFLDDLSNKKFNAKDIKLSTVRANRKKGRNLIIKKKNYERNGRKNTIRHGPHIRKISILRVVNLLGGRDNHMICTIFNH